MFACSLFEREGVRFDSLCSFFANFTFVCAFYGVLRRVCEGNVLFFVNGLCVERDEGNEGDVDGTKGSLAIASRGEITSLPANRL